MGRAIIYIQPPVRKGLGVAPGPEPDTSANDPYQERLIKLVPAEAITIWLAISKVLLQPETKAEYFSPLELAWGAFVVLSIALVIYSRRFLKSKWPQTIGTVLAFAVWGFSLGTPFDSLSWYSDRLAAIVVLLYTFVVPMIVGPAVEP